MAPALGETLPTTDRAMIFRLTARDNNPDGGRIGEDTTTVTSTTSAGPFQVTAPNGGEKWDGTETVTWDVAGTAGGSVNTPKVDIRLSVDGGVTWPFALASGVSNDGSQSVSLPDVDTSAASVKVMGSGNIFFDTSDSSFTIGTVMNETLVGQGASCAGTAYSSQLLSDYGIATDLADDFTVPPGEQWTLGGVSAPGVFSSSADPLESVNVFVWSDSGGLPGSIVSGCSFPSLPPASGLSDPNIEADLPGTCVLGPGTYWIEVQAVMSFDPKSSQWFWQANSGPFGAEFAFRDEPDLYATGCTVWSSGGTCLGAAENDLCFTLSGSTGGGSLIFADGFESGDTTAWSSSVP
jgi:hypothetical protein